jgi:transposase InsO family protein
MQVTLLIKARSPTVKRRLPILSGVKNLFIEPGSLRENGYIEPFNGKMRDELLDREIFFPLEEAKILIARWKDEYNHISPHIALGYRPPAPQAWLLAAQLVSALGLV